MSSQDLFLELKEKYSTLETALNLFGKRGREYAEAERDYRIELAKQMLTERDKGTPTTILRDVCRGKAEVAELAFKRDTAEVMYKSAMEAINVYKLECRALNNEIDREWNRS